MEGGDRKGNGQFAAAPPPPRAEDRVAVPAGPPPAQDAVDAPRTTRRFARTGPEGEGLAPPPRPAQADNTLFMPPPRAADRVTPPAAFPPPVAEHRIGY